MRPVAHRPVICCWCHADITPEQGGYDLMVTHCTICGCTFVTGALGS